MFYKSKHAMVLLLLSAAAFANPHLSQTATTPTLRIRPPSTSAPSENRSC